MRMRDGSLQYPHPEYPGVFVSRQRIWQLRRKAEGRCIRCGKKRTRSLSFCDRCVDLTNAADMRAYYARKSA